MKLYLYICLLVFHTLFIASPLFALNTVYSSDNNAALNAFDLAEAEKYDEAIKVIDVILAEDSNNSLAYYVKGYIQQKNMDFDLAIQSYTTIIDLAKTDKITVLAYSGRGNCWEEKFVFDKAVFDFTKVIELEPTNTIAYFDRARVWLLLGESKAAINDYTNIINLNPNEIPLVIDAYAKRAVLFLKKGEWDLALVDLKKIIALDSESP